MTPEEDKSTKGNIYKFLQTSIRESSTPTMKRVVFYCVFVIIIGILFCVFLLFIKVAFFDYTFYINGEPFGLYIKEKNDHMGGIETEQKSHTDNTTELDILVDTKLVTYIENNKKLTQRIESKIIELTTKIDNLSLNTNNELTIKRRSKKNLCGENFRIEYIQKTVHGTYNILVSGESWRGAKGEKKKFEKDLGHKKIILTLTINEYFKDDNNIILNKECEVEKNSKNKH